MTYGYIRVSTLEQNEARQRCALAKAGIPPARIYMDKQSGKDFYRPRYLAMRRKLKAGDLVCVTSIDRLGRNYDEIIRQWRTITKEKKADILVLDMPLLDTRLKRDLVGTLISDLILQIFSYVAQTEREMIRKRQAEGIAAAKQRGVRFGHEARPLPDNFPDVLALWKQGLLSTAEAARETNMSRTTFRRRVMKLHEHLLD